MLPRSERFWALLVFAAFALPLLVAIWALPGFLVQDGPLYLYNSHIMLESLQRSSRFHQYFAVDWTPLPYWGAYALLMALMPVIPPRAADQVLMTLTSVGFASALMWLRWRTWGWQGMAIVVPLMIVLSINVLWMLGLYSFLLGAIFYFITLGYWWRSRDGVGPKQAAILAALLIAGYFCHLVSFGLTLVGIVILAGFTSGVTFHRRIKWTALSIVPVVPLIIHYMRAMGAEGGTGMRWIGISNPLSLNEWLVQLSTADVPTIHNSGMEVPGSAVLQLLFRLPRTSLWALVGLVLVMSASVLRRSMEDRASYRDLRGWTVLVAVLVVGGLFGPDDLGSSHGILRERVLLLGFATAIIPLRIDSRHILTRLGFVVLMFLAAAQLRLLWDYALKSDALVGQFMDAKPYVGKGHRMAAVMVDTGWQYRTNPLIHVPNMLGIDTDNLVWNNYGPALYYFPLKHRNEEAKQRSLFIGNRLHYASFTSSERKEAALNGYRAMMERSHGEIDVLVLWSSTPELDSINRLWFEPQPLYENEKVKVLRHLTH